MRPSTNGTFRQAGPFPLGGAFRVRRLRAGTGEPDRSARQHEEKRTAPAEGEVMAPTPNKVPGLGRDGSNSPGPDRHDDGKRAARASVLSTMPEPNWNLRIGSGGFRGSGRSRRDLPDHPESDRPDAMELAGRSRGRAATAPDMPPRRGESAPFHGQGSSHSSAGSRNSVPSLTEIRTAPPEVGTTAPTPARILRRFGPSLLRRLAVGESRSAE